MPTNYTPPSHLPRITSREASRDVATAVEMAGTEGRRAVLTRYGVPVAALVSIDDLAQLEAAKSTAPADPADFLTDSMTLLGERKEN